MVGCKQCQYVSLMQVCKKVNDSSYSVLQTLDILLTCLYFILLSSTVAPKTPCATIWAEGESYFSQTHMKTMERSGWQNRMRDLNSARYFFAPISNYLVSSDLNFLSPPVTSLEKLAYGIICYVAEVCDILLILYANLCTD